MLKNSFILICFLFSTSYALSINEIIDSAIINNKDLQSIKKNISVANEQIKLSQKWDNPIFSIGANDIHFDSSRRDLEAMQAQFIGFSQTIPTNNKLTITKKISIQDKEIASLSYEDAKLKLKSKLIQYTYFIKILEKKYLLLNEYQENIRSLEKLTKSLYENNQVNQSMLLKTDIAYFKIELEKENLQNIIKNSYLKLEEISYMKIQNLDISLELKNLTLNKDIKNHPKLQLIKINSEKFNKQAQLEEAKKISDIKVNLAYFQRDDKYKDYANFSISIPLNFYGREDIKVLQAKIKSQSFRDKLIDTKNSFDTKINILQNDIDSSYKKYEILSKSIIPLINKNQITLEKYNSVDLVKPQEILENLNLIIKEKLLILDEMKNYFTFLSESYYYTKGHNL